MNKKLEELLLEEKLRLINKLPIELQNKGYIIWQSNYNTLERYSRKRALNYANNELRRYVKNNLGGKQNE